MGRGALMALLVVVATAAAGCDSRTPPGDGRVANDATVDAATQCAPSDPPQLSARIVESGGTYKLQLRNVGCGVATRLVGCCGEGQPSFETLDASGAWQQTQCMLGGGACCNALPQCKETATGDGFELELGDLMLCKGKTVRARLAYGDACDPTQPWTSKMPLSAISNAVDL